jgi:hypothetical protein
MRFAIVAHRAGETNIGLVTRRWRTFEPLLLTPREALAALGENDAALGRLDIRDGLDGIEDGLWALSELSAVGIAVLNPPAALISAHDKLVTARALRRAGLPHPETRPLNPGRQPTATRSRSSSNRGSAAGDATSISAATPTSSEVASSSWHGGAGFAPTARSYRN